MNVLKLVLLTSSCSLLLHVLPSEAANFASNATGNLRAVQGKSLVYESYVSDDPKDCQKISDSSTSFTGGSALGISAYVGDSRASDKPLSLSCPKGYTMVNMTSQTSGVIVTVGAGGGTITNNGDAKCCPVKYRYAPPKATA
jgi:hypothetical protein